MPSITTTTGAPRPRYRRRGALDTRPAGLTLLGTLYAEHQALLAAEAAAWVDAEGLLGGDPRRPDAVNRWSAAKEALDAFPARIAAVRTTGLELVKFKAQVLAGLHLGDLDFAVTAALEKAAAGGHVADEALALSIARDLAA